MPEGTTILTTKIRLRPDSHTVFANWQAEFNAAIATFPGFVSLEILSLQDSKQFNWVIVQRFYNAENLSVWRDSKERQKLLEELKPFVTANGLPSIENIESKATDLQGGVTEVFVTQVNPKREKAYRDWVAKIHGIEAKFPGFRGVYVQSPGQGQGQSWITLLQFDTPEHLDRWLSSPDRQKILQESQPLISSLESRRMVSPYAGWFSSVYEKGKAPPPAWKQTMIVLLVLFPIVMFELKYLSPLTASLDSSLATFISNAISVSLISWPMTPIAILFLGWWLSPPKERERQFTLWGTLIVLILYLLEIILFWNFL